MYCIIDNRNKTFITGKFADLINQVYKWKYEDGTLHYKCREYAKEEHYIFIDGFTKIQMYSTIMNYLWVQLERFDYSKYIQVE